MDKLYELEKLHLEPDDIVLMIVDITQFGPKEAREMFENLKQTLPNTPMICIPKGVKLTAKHKQDLINYLIDEVD